MSASPHIQGYQQAANDDRQMSTQQHDNMTFLDNAVRKITSINQTQSLYALAEVLVIDNLILMLVLKSIFKNTGIG